MPIEKLVLILVVVVTAAAITVWGGVTLLAFFSISPVLGIALLSILALVAYILFRVVSERLSNEDDDHYDSMEN